MTVVILFKEMHGLDLSRLLQHLEERVSEQFFKKKIKRTVSERLRGKGT
jgi:hypothetical protein